MKYYDETNSAMSEDGDDDAVDIESDVSLRWKSLFSPVRVISSECD